MSKRDAQASSFDTTHINHQLEALEPRVLLTTLIGGDVFEYIDAQGQNVRVVLEGDAIVELIGGNINNSNNSLELGDLPGVISSSELGREGSVAGGLGGADGIELRSLISINGNFGPQETFDIRALATNADTGNTWAMQVVGTTAQIIEFDAETGTGTIRYTLDNLDIGGTAEAPVTEIVGAAFDIRAGNSDILYFVTQVGESGGAFLRSVDTSTGVVSVGTRTLVSAGEATAGNRVRGMTFDQTGPGVDDYDLVIAAVRTRAIEGGTTQANRIERSTVANDFFNSTPVTGTFVDLAGDPVTDITSIGFKTNDANAAETQLYATTAGSFLLVNLNTGLTQLLGQLEDPNDSRDNPRGGAISAVTWDADSINPFTGDVGVFVGMDSDTDELVYLDDRPRFDTADLFAIYVSQSSENAKLSISVLPPINPARPGDTRTMTPYGSTIGSTRVINISNSPGVYALASPEAGAGGVWIGARTEDLGPDIDDEDLLPIISALLTTSIGVRPAGLDTDAYSVNNLAAGIFVAPSIVEYVAESDDWAGRLLGSNLDKLTSLAANRFGAIAAIDTDRRDTDNLLVGDQLAFLDGDTGKPTADPIVTIHDGIGDLTGTSAIAYGFADLDQIDGESDEELYAIINNRFGTLDSAGLFVEIDADLTLVTPLVLTADASIRSMTFAPGGLDGKQTLYIIADPDGTDSVEQSVLYTVQYDVVGGVISAITSITQVSGIHDLNLNSMTFDAAGRLLAQDRDNGKLVQLSTADGSVIDLGDESPAGSLRATVGGIAYDLAGDRILLVDNATGQQVIANEAFSIESSALLQLKTESTGQNFGTMLIAGAVSGQVYFSGSVDTFYAGWIVTGQTGGQILGDPELPGNFYVEGDLRNLVTSATIGTNNVDSGTGVMNYNAGVDIYVGGRLGTIQGEASGSFRLMVGGVDTIDSLTTDVLPQQEIEFRQDDTQTSTGAGLAFESFRLYNATAFTNDTIATAQMLGTVSTGVPGEADIIRVQGALDSFEESGAGADTVDHYGVALLAGQTVTVSIGSYDDFGDFFFGLPVGVYDTQGRMIASAYGASDGPSVFTFTAEEPGIYTIGVLDVFENIEYFPGIGSFPYELTVENAGTMTLGAVDLQNDYFYVGTDSAITVFNGDMGIFRVGGEMAFNYADAEFDLASTVFDVTVYDNLRAVTAGTIGTGGLAGAQGLNLNVIKTVGLVSTTVGELSLPASFVGGNIQKLEAATSLRLNVYVNGGIGVIYAQSMPSNTVSDFDDTQFLSDTSFIRVNYDGIGNDGIIDLIDVEGDIGDELTGGVAITTGPSGNVRYMRVGGTAYQDAFFSSGDSGVITGTSVSVTDDSGAKVNMSATFGGTLSVSTYGIRGSGGSVIVKVVSTTGLSASSATGQNGSSAEISEIVVSDGGRPLIIDPIRRTVREDSTSGVDPVNVVINGSSPLDVFSIVGGNLSTISNNSGGEIVNIAATSIALLYAAGSLGVAKQHNDTAVMGSNIVFDEFPFVAERNAITVGDIGIVRSDRAVGSIIAHSSFGGSGTIGSVTANHDNRNDVDVYEGIAGVLFASGDIYYVCIGEGLGSAGTGHAADVGIFANGFIGTVTNQGLGSDIKGTIMSLVGIDQIILVGGGSLIDAEVYVVLTISATYPYNLNLRNLGGETITIAEGSYINKVSVTGNGGIIGTTFLASQIGDVTVRGGFGIINSDLLNLSVGTIGNIYADGYGLRNVRIGDGVTVGNITAGERSDEDLDVSSYTPSVRQSEFDPDAATIYNDLETALLSHVFFGTGNFDALDLDYTYTAGVIYSLIATGSYSLGNVKAYTVQEAIFNFAQSIDSLVTDENIYGVSMTTGAIKTIQTGNSRMRGDIIGSDFSIAGDINTLAVYGDIDSTLIQTNNNGTINRFNIYIVKDQGGGNFTNFSELIIAGRVNTIDIAGDIDNSTISILSGSSGTYSVGRFILGGNLFGTLEFFDDVNQISIAGSLGALGDRLVVHGSVRSITVGSDRSILGVELGLDLVILGDLGTLTVNGALTGSLTVAGSLQRLSVSADSTQLGTDILTGDINVTQIIRSISIRDGNVSGSIFAGGDLSTVSITNGSFTSTAVASSHYGMIRSFSVSGDMNGVVEVNNGDLSNLRIGGDMGASAEILAMSARSISVTGHIVGGASIQISKILSTLTAGYIGDGATAVDITAGGVQSISTRGVRNINDGDLYANMVLGDSGRASRISVAGNFGGMAVVTGDLGLTVRGNVDMDVTAGEYLMVTGSLGTLNVTGDLSGGIFVAGGGNNWMAGSITNAIITSGFDLRGLTSRGAVTNSLIQVGIAAGTDLTFATIDGQQDLGEQSRRATLGRFSADSVDNSIVAAGGDITSVAVRNDVSDSSFSSGWSVGSLGIVERMGGELDGDILREQDGRALFRGSIRTFAAANLFDSYVTAGVDAGVGGDFSAPTVIYDNAGTVRNMVDGGGVSTIGSIRGTTDAGSRIVADSGIVRDSTSGAATINGNVTYALADLEQGNALAASVGIATQATPLVYSDSGLTITITVRGAGSVDARDVTLADGILDGLVITGTTSSTTIDIKTSNPGAVDIGRIFTGDDAELRSLSFDGGIVGDGTTGLDAWLDGNVGTLSLGGFGDTDALNRVTGSIGGDVSTFNLGFQEAGTLRIAGAVRTMTVESGNGDPLQINRRQYVGRNFSSLAFDGANVFGVDSGLIYTIDPLTDASVAGVAVTDATLGSALNILGMDIENGSGDVYAVASLANQNPTQQISSVTSDLTSLAVRPSDGAIFAIRYNATTDVDQLVRLNATTGAVTVVGTLQDIFGVTYGTSAGTQVMTLAFRNDVLLAVLTDRYGANGGVGSVAADITLAAIATTANAQGFVRVTSPTGNQALPPVVMGTNAGEVYTGMATNAGGQLFVIRNDNVIVEINPTTGVDIAPTHTFAGLTLTGIGFDINDNLIGLDSVTNRLYLLDLGTDTATALGGGNLAAGLNAFAIGKTNVNGAYVSYAYDDVDDIGIAGDERAFYASAGQVTTLGIVDPVTGLFTQLGALVQDAQGTPLAGNVLSVAVDSTNTRVKVLTDESQIATYNTDGTLDLGTPLVDLVNSRGKTVTSIAKIDIAADGRLIGFDSQSKQLVTIDPDTGLVSALTEPGSLTGNIASFTIDEVTGLAMVFNSDNSQIATVASFTQVGLSGISADSISRLTIGDDYASRIAATGNLDNASIMGDFDGMLSAGGTMRSLTMSNGEFTGTIYAGGDLSRASMRNVDFLSDGLLWANNKLSLDVSKGSDFDGLINGRINAGNLVNLRGTGTELSSATIIAHNDASSISLGGAFDGMMDLAQLTRSLTITGELQSGAQIVVYSDVSTISLRGGAQANTLLAIEGQVRSLTVGETFSGVLGIKSGLQRGSFDTLASALISVGLDTQSFSVRGDMTSSLVSLGTWFGEDHVYNTLDDVITGGTARTISISGNYRNSITAMGVLPSFELGGFIPGVDSNFAFLGNGSVDRAEAGGLFRSVISSFTIRGEISSTNIGAGFVAGLVSADEITRISTSQATGNTLRQRVYNDPYGPVQVLTVTRELDLFPFIQVLPFTSLTSSRFEIILSEPVLTSSVILSVDTNGDNDITDGSGDIQGSIQVTDGNGDILNNITLVTSTRMIDGVLRGVITGISPTAIVGLLPANAGDPVTATVSFLNDLPTVDTYAQTPVLMDRSGLRSALRSFNGDPLGTLFDSDDDGFEG